MWGRSIRSAKSSSLLKKSMFCLLYWRIRYMREAKKEDSSLDPIISYKILWVIDRFCSFSSMISFSLGFYYLLLPKKCNISVGVLEVIEICFRDWARSSSALDTSEIPFLRHFLRSFSNLWSLRKNFWACERTCEVVLEETTLSISFQFLPWAIMAKLIRWYLLGRVDALKDSICLQFVVIRLIYLCLLAAWEINIIKINTSL